MFSVIFARDVEGISLSRQRVNLRLVFTAGNSAPVGDADFARLIIRKYNVINCNFRPPQFRIVRKLSEQKKNYSQLGVQAKFIIMSILENDQYRKKLKVDPYRVGYPSISL